MLLAIGNSSEYERCSFDAVQRSLAVHGHEILLFKQDACLEGEYVSFEYESGGTRAILTIDGTDYDASMFEAIWLLKPILPRRLLEHPNVEYREFIQKQFFAMRDGLRWMFRNTRWLNDPVQQRLADNKPYQLDQAAQCGLRVPATVITSDPGRAQEFMREHPMSIVKPLALHPLSGRMVYASVPEGDQLKRLEGLKLAPCIIQEMVPKAYELRITVVGDKVFSAEIMSQADAGTAIDYRRKPIQVDAVPVRATEIPHELKTSILALMSKLGLRFGCLDLVVTPDNGIVFLEVNPNGQWWFVQRETGLPIAEAIAAQLLVD